MKDRGADFASRYSTMNSMLPLSSRLTTIPLMVASAALFLMMCMTFSDVVLRSSFDAPIEAATELTRILMAVVVFSSLPVCSGRGEHISVDLLDGYFSPFWARLRDGIISLLCGAILLWPAQRVTVLAQRAADYGDLTEYLQIQQSYIAWGIAVATFVTALVLILRGMVILILGGQQRD